MKKPDRLYRVRWRRAKWTSQGTSSRLFVRERAAIAFARRLVAKSWVTDEVIGVVIEYRTLEPGDWTEIEVDG